MTTGTRPIRVAVQPQLQRQHAPYARLRDAVRASEDLGVDFVYDWDHLFPLSGDPNGLPDVVRCWVASRDRRNADRGQRRAVALSEVPASARQCAGA